MSILGKLFDRILNRKKDDSANTQQQPTSATATTAQANTGGGAPAQAPRGQANPGQPMQPMQPVPAQAAPQASGMQANTTERVDIEKVLNDMAAKNPQKLNWRTSIVDLMQLVGMESSLAERKELADELGYKGDKSDSAAMNIWLHKQVMKKLEENGGKVPADLKD